MVRSAMMKKMTLRLLAVALTLMTAVAFMPTAADIVWAAGTASDPNANPGGTGSATAPTFALTGPYHEIIKYPDKKDEHVFDISHGSIQVYGNRVEFQQCTIDEDTGEVTFFSDPKITVLTGIDAEWYTKNQIVITGTTKAYTLYRVKTDDGDDLYLTEEQAKTAATKNNATYDGEVTLEPHSVQIHGGPHYVTLRDLNMSPGSADYNPVRLTGSSPNTELTLSGTNNITGRNLPAIAVQYDGTLKIGAEDGGSLTALVEGNNDYHSAAIGGYGSVVTSSFGKITIDSGTIIAKGLGSGAGIGGSNAGSGEIIINGGDITATGGNSNSVVTGAPGIGGGASAQGGSVTINDGKVTAFGGKDASGSVSYGIKANTLSTNGNTVVLSSTLGVSAAKDDAFNAIVWTDKTNTGTTPKNATVYGDVLLANVEDGNTSTQSYVPEGSDKEVLYQPIDLASCKLIIPKEASVTAYPPDSGHYKFGNNSTVSGPGKLIGIFENYTPDETEHPTIVYSLIKGCKSSEDIPADYKNQHEFIHVVGLDEGMGAYKVYDGRAKKLDDLIKIDETTEKFGIKHTLDVDDWNVTVWKEASNTTTLGRVDIDKIIEAGTYRIEFSHKKQHYDNFYIYGIRILPKDMSKSMIKMNTPYSYGDTIEYSVTDSATGQDLRKGDPGDYLVTFHTYEKNEHGEAVTGSESLVVDNPNDPLDAGNYVAVFKATNGGNYTTKEDILVPFTVKPASIKNATVEIYGSNAFVYNGEPQDVNNISVTLKGKTLNREDYVVTYKNNSPSISSEETDTDPHITYAGTVTVTVKPSEICKNYTDYAITAFDIAKRPVEVESAVAAYYYDNDQGNKVPLPRRTYDGTNLVNIIDAKLIIGQSTSNHCIIEDDEEEVWVNVEGLEDDPTDNLTGTVSNSDAGIYPTVKLSNVRLAGRLASNYTVVDSSVTLNRPEGYTESFEGFEITRLPVDTPTIEVTDKLSTGDKEKFLCTVKVTNAPNVGAMYLYGMTEKEGDIDNIKWQTSNEFDKLKSNTTYWFYSKVDNESEKAKKNTYPVPNDPIQIAYAKHTTPLIPQDPPEEFELEITLDPNGETYTVTIPLQEGAQYSFDGKNYSKSNVLKGVGANETITGYARFPATKTHAVSEAVSATDVTPPLTVKTPVISPENGEFYGSVKVTISCATQGATIYYTTDGNYPVAGKSEVYRTPITVTEDTTISAIAVKEDMEESEMASVNYVYTEYEPKTEAKVSSGIKITNDLKTSPTYNQKDSITAALSRAITEDGGGYTYQNIAYYDLNVKISFDNGVKFVNATADNFPEEGVEVTVPFPKNTGESSHDFRVAHMFSETSDRLGTTAGEIEKPDVTESAAGLTFTVNGCSPLAIGWVETGDENAAGADGENADDEGGNAADGEDADTLNANGEAANGENADGANGAGANANGGADADGTGADGENADGTGGSGAGGVVDELVNAVTTGDYTNPILWAAIALVSLLFIIIIVAVRRRA